MLSAFTPTVTLFLLYVSGVEVPTTGATLAVVAIGFGCLLSSYGEGHFNPVPPKHQQPRCALVPSAPPTPQPPRSQERTPADECCA